MKRIAVVVTARPSYSRIRTALLALTKAGADLQVIAAASALTWRHGRVVDIMRADGLGPVFEVPAVVEGERCEAAMTTGLLTMQLAPILAGLKPDCVVTIADRHETLATAIAASYQHIPLCHVQGGEVSGSIDDKVRNAVTQLADLHLVATDKAAERVEYVRPDMLVSRVKVTGCPSIDLAAEAVRLGPIHKADVIVLQHPVTGEVEQAGAQMRATIEAVGSMWGIEHDELRPLYFWPGDEPGSDAMSKELRLAGIHPVRNLEPVEFLRVLLGAKVLVGNSSVGIRECSYLGVPVVNIGTRQNGRERAENVEDVPAVASDIGEAVGRQTARRYKPSTLYGDGQAGKRIAQALMEWQ